MFFPCPLYIHKYCIGLLISLKTHPGFWWALCWIRSSVCQQNWAFPSINMDFFTIDLVFDFCQQWFRASICKSCDNFIFIIAQTQLKCRNHLKTPRSLAIPTLGRQKQGQEFKTSLGYKTEPWLKNSSDFNTIQITWSS